MEREIPFSSKVRKLLEAVSRVTEFSEQWSDAMESFLPYLSEDTFCFPKHNCFYT